MHVQIHGHTYTLKKKARKQQIQESMANMSIKTRDELSPFKIQVVMTDHQQP
jgi:hypothetical protein